LYDVLLLLLLLLLSPDLKFVMVGSSAWVCEHRSGAAIKAVSIGAEQSRAE
jgi:hypothetical protein